MSMVIFQIVFFPGEKKTLHCGNAQVTHAEAGAWGDYIKRWSNGWGNKKLAFEFRRFVEAFQIIMSSTNQILDPGIIIWIEVICIWSFDNI